MVVVPPAIAAKVEATLEETSALLEAVHGLDATELADYRATILRRFANPALPDTVERVGRQPLRKLSRNERFVSPAASAAERGLPTTALVAAMGAALEFDVPEDEQSVEMQRRLRVRDTATPLLQRREAAPGADAVRGRQHRRDAVEPVDARHLFGERPPVGEVGAP